MGPIPDSGEQWPEEVATECLVWGLGFGGLNNWNGVNGSGFTGLSTWNKSLGDIMLQLQSEVVHVGNHLDYYITLRAQGPPQ